MVLNTYMLYDKSLLDVIFSLCLSGHSSLLLHDTRLHWAARPCLYSTSANMDTSPPLLPLKSTFKTKWRQPGIDWLKKWRPQKRGFQRRWREPKNCSQNEWRRPKSASLGRKTSFLRNCRRRKTKWLSVRKPTRLPGYGKRNITKNSVECFTRSIITATRSLVLKG